ncbi:MAG TPA: A/G-specific adenine glycosylase [Polyangia bacterium]
MNEAPKEKEREIRRALIRWFRAGHRKMPWRELRDPYAIWVSEIMLQQTRVDTVVPYFEKWMARFPSVRALAKAPLDDVLEHWAGLGYYARARNLHAAAREIETRYGGRFPDAPEEVRALPGVGPYTAGAILSIAFGQAAPILDGNVARVLARVYARAGAVDDPALRKELWALAAKLVPEGAASDFNQAMMELGATVCAPRAPDCARCPLSQVCEARAQDRIDALPGPKRKRPPKPVDAVTVLLERRGEVLLVRRPPSGLWGGLWEPPTGELERGEVPAEAAARVAMARTGLFTGRIEALDRFEHVLTHRRMRFFPFRAEPRGRLKLAGYEAARWLEPRAAARLGIAAWTARLLSERSNREERR